MKKYKVAVVGAAGYAGGELIRLLINHPYCEAITAVSRSQYGSPITSVHEDLFGECNILFSDNLNGDESVIFLCMSHGEAGIWLNENRISKDTLIIDLSQDFRYANDEFIYGLPEFNYNEIRESRRIANPGCFATVIQLMLLPLNTSGYLNNDVNIVATTGSTGAGQTLSATSHFTWRNNNHSAYKVLNHQHLFEIGETLKKSNSVLTPNINIVPQRGAFSRGIHATAWIKNESTSQGELDSIFKMYYNNSSFVFVTEEAPDVKQIVNTNKCFLHVEYTAQHIVITGVIDNLLKGASGQAVQNMNIALNLPEKTGLQLKPLAY